MSKYIFCFLLLVLTFLYPLGITETTVKAINFKSEGITELQALLTKDPLLKGAIVGMSVRSATTGDLLYSYNGDTSLTPASNLKLFTAAAALQILGPNYTYQTEVRTNGKINRKGLLRGNLYLKGKGDPTLTVEDLKVISKKLKQKGINTINGDLIADDTWYDDVRYSIDLPWSDETAYYGAQISALTVSPDEDYDAGTIILEVSPSKVGKKPNVNLIPNTKYIKLVSNAKTVEMDNKKEIKIMRVHGTNEIHINGSIGIDELPKKEWISVWDPTKYTLALFIKALHQEGINVRGEEHIGKTPVKTKVLLTHQSEPLSAILLPLLKLSNNTIAEMFIKEIGRTVKKDGSWETGIEIEKKSLEELGLNMSGTVLRDGSGISPINTIQANTVTQLLFKVQSMHWFSPFYESLPIAGEKGKLVGGTLQNRMTRTPLQKNVIAKTGTLTNVSSLSGYLQTQSGENVIFSIILNHLKDEKDGKFIEERILDVMTQYIE